MDLQDITIEEIPHGHGASFKKGVNDGILDKSDFKNDLPPGHDFSYKRGIALGKKLKEIIAKKVRK